jgi:hypothetical protein
VLVIRQFSVAELAQTILSQQYAAPEKTAQVWLPRADICVTSASSPSPASGE